MSGEAEFAEWWERKATSEHRRRLRTVARTFDAVPHDIEQLLLAAGVPLIRVWGESDDGQRTSWAYFSRAMYELVLARPPQLEDTRRLVLEQDPATVTDINAPRPDNVVPFERPS